ncbi:integrin beta pat-3-like [Leptidea sinapis]|uniref:Integrin beta n=1 Tax=Leptidea sinapis TaxID=189913 RepID=A0A5E4QHU8_9NEOP|nr:integrin beta pat-3-like [Leptidea sinapis]VVC97300.1 unnamed protein product [Leptidea sinapis]
MNLRLLLLLLLYKEVHSKCEEHIRCESCIKDNNNCVWCAADTFGPESRCKPYTPDTSWCINDIIYPQSSYKIIENKSLSSDFGNVVQIIPQKIEMDMRPGQEVEFSFNFKRARDYPIDMYFLVDGSESMITIRDNIIDEAETIYGMMGNISRNVTLGIGTFVDKNALPFTQKVDQTLTYSFRNQLKLTDDIQQFKKILRDIKFGKNYDPQEGTLDALAQVITCNKEISWRDESRRVIIVLTNAPYHAAGDAKFAGIDQPYDGQCYTINGGYSKELELDYPSTSVLRRLISNEGVSVIFIVNSDEVNTYHRLTKIIGGSELTYDKNKIASKLSSIYEGITNKISLKVNMDWRLREFLKISFKPDCYQSKVNTNCLLKQEEEKTISGNIKLLKYFDAANINLDIGIEGIREKLTIKINTIKKCDCRTETNTEACSTKGVKRCGICECNEDREGDKCECEKGASNIKDDSSCKMPNTTTICNRNGICKCGRCNCRNEFTGQFCECKIDSCPRDPAGALCSNHGHCDCGTCTCDDGWIGDRCQCPTTEEMCTLNNKTCNGRGICTCGECGCDAIADWDSRNKQNELCVIQPCTTCHTPQCLKLTPCVLCLMSSNECQDCGHLNVTVLTNVTHEDEWMVCYNIHVDLGCSTKFIYRYSLDRYGIDVIAQTSFDCAASYYMFGGGCLALLLFIGLATLVAWKLLTNARDRREYETFLKDVAAQSASVDNCTYIPPSTTFSNPLFGDNDH